MEEQVIAGKTILNLILKKWRLYSLPNIWGEQIKKMRWAGHVAHIGVLVGKPEVKRPLERPRCRWKVSIEIGLKEVRWRDMDWIDKAQNMEECRALVNAVMNLRVP